MTDEALFFRRFVDDVRRCAAGRAHAAVAEIERRVRVAMISSPSVRERRWARVVTAVNELLATAGDADVAAIERLRAFVRENADLGRPRDVAITDFRLTTRAESIVTIGAERRYLVFATIARAASRPIAALEEIVPGPTRRVTEWAVYALCGGAALTALWFAFVAPV
jgi:hypothetical protein